MELQRTTRLIFPFILSFSLIACGGGGGFSSDGSGTGTTNGNGTSSNPNNNGGGDGSGTTEPSINTLRLSSSAFQLQSAGDNPITLSAIAKDANNVLLEGANIQISVDNDADLTPTVGTSIKTSTLTPGIPDNRMLTVTATVGDKTETLNIEVIGTTLVLDGPASVTLNKPAAYKMVVRDSADNPVSNRTIDLPVVSGPCSIDTPASSVLDSAGEYAFSILGTGEGICTVSASNFGADATLDISVSGDEFTIAATTDKANDVLNGDDTILEVPVGTPETITLQLKKNNAAIAGKTIQLSSTRGTLSEQSVVTDANGVASFTISSANSGAAVVTASVDGLQAVLKDLEFVADNPVYITTQASPSVVKPLGKSVITTTIKDLDGNPIKNKVITFNLSDTVGGKLNASQAKTDSLGRASVEYTAGNTSSETDGVVIVSNVQGSTTITDTIKLTVGGNALRIVLGTDNRLVANELTYTQRFIVMVTDSAGNPVANQNISATLAPTDFYKGVMVPVDTDGDGEADEWSDLSISLPLTSPPSYEDSYRCTTEDINNNSNLDLGEDKDGDARLEPTHDATVTGGAVTGEDGSAILEVTYPKSRALWSKQKLVVRTTLAGSEYEENTTFRLSILKADKSDVTISPPSSSSPYGVTADCSRMD